MHELAIDWPRRKCNERAHTQTQTHSGEKKERKKKKKERKEEEKRREDKNDEWRKTCSSWANKLIYFSFCYRCWCWSCCCLMLKCDAINYKLIRTFSIHKYLTIIITIRKSIDDAQLKYLFILDVMADARIKEAARPGSPAGNGQRAEKKETHLYMIECVFEWNWTSAKV